MKFLIKNHRLVLYSIFVLFYFQCSSSKEIRDISKTFTYDVTYQYWVSDDEKVKGFDLLIPIKYNPENIDLDSVYFKRMSSKLTIWNHNEIKYYIGRFYTTSEVNKDTSGAAAKYFQELKDNECIVTYKRDSTTYNKKLKDINDISHLPFYLTRDR